jgi:very-short-patch-repair endonuclease
MSDVSYPSPAKRGEGGRPKAGRVGVVVANTNARALRKRLTPQEVKLWVKLRELKPLGFHFRRQAPIGRYIVDFASFASRIVVEIDGGQHGMSKGLRSDRERDAFLRSQGFNVLRYWNSDVDDNIDGVIESILSALKTPTPALRADPPHASRGRD